MTTTTDQRHTVDHCPHRVLVAEGDSATAQCRLLDAMLPGAPRELYQVERQACEACCESFAPQVDAPNPVVASLLWGIAERLLDDSTVPEPVRARSEQILQRAEACLPVTYPDEDDLCPWPPVLELVSEHEPIAKLVPKPRWRCGPSVTRWAVGVTTAPRRLSTLDYCLESLLQAGWESPRLFIDGPVDISRRFADLPQTLHATQIGAWPNFYLGLAELAMRQPEADAYLMVQDDALLIRHPGLRSYLEQILWPGDEPGVVSLYCSREYSQPRAGWHRFCGQWTQGALAFILSRRSAQRFLADFQVLLHRWDSRHGQALIDTVLGRWAAQNHVPLFFPTPSLAQHIGHTSTIWHAATASGARRAQVFSAEWCSESEINEPERAALPGGGNGAAHGEVKLAALPGIGARSSLPADARRAFEPAEVCLGDQHFPDSLLIEAPAQLLYRLNGAYREFDAAVAVRHLPESRSLAAEFVVLADERQVAVAPHVVPDDQALRLRGDISGAKLLRLIVNPIGPDACHAIWLTPLVREQASVSVSTAHDCLHRAVVDVVAPRPRCKRCIATVASAGFEQMLDQMLGSLVVNGGCRDAQIVVLLAGSSDACRRIAAKYHATVVACMPIREPNATLKSVLYSIAHYVDAEQYLCLDVDTLILGDLRPIFAALGALPEKSILVCRETNWLEFRDLEHALCTVYGGVEGDLQWLAATPQEARYALVVNDGVFAGSQAALLEVDRTLRAMPQAAAWIDERPDVTWRNQWVFNLVLARLNCAVELCPTYNVQLNRQDVEVNREDHGVVASLHGKPARILHFNGLGRHKHVDLRRMFGEIPDPLIGVGTSDTYATFLEALHRWIARRGRSILATTFYGTGDGYTASIPDPDVLSMLALLHHLVRSSGYRRILESGTGLGVSTACLAAAVAPLTGARVATYDLQVRPEREELWQLCPPEFRACIEARTGDALEGLQRAYAAGEQFDLALLDSSHQGEHVWKEFQLATRLVKPHGLILIHDVTNVWETAGEAVSLIEAAGYGVVRLWTEGRSNAHGTGLGLALIENRRAGGPST